jgi:hypothetical protein
MLSAHLPSCFQSVSLEKRPAIDNIQDLVCKRLCCLDNPQVFKLQIGHNDSPKDHNCKDDRFCMPPALPAQAILITPDPEHKRQQPNTKHTINQTPPYLANSSAMRVLLGVAPMTRASSMTTAATSSALPSLLKSPIAKSRMQPVSLRVLQSWASPSPSQ